MGGLDNHLSVDPAPRLFDFGTPGFADVVERIRVALLEWSGLRCTSTAPAWCWARRRLRARLVYTHSPRAWWMRSGFAMSDSTPSATSPTTSATTADQTLPVQSAIDIRSRHPQVAVVLEMQTDRVGDPEPVFHAQPIHRCPPA